MLGDAAIKLAADERTAKRLVRQRTGQLETIQSQLSERRALLSGVRSTIRRMASDQAKSKPATGATVEPPSESVRSHPRRSASALPSARCSWVFPVRCCAVRGCWRWKAAY